MASSALVRIPASRLAQLKAIAEARTGKLSKHGSTRRIHVAQILEEMIQREWQKEFPDAPTPDFQIGAGVLDGNVPCVRLVHSQLGRVLLTAEKALVLGRGSRRVAEGVQENCFVAEGAFTKKDVMVSVRPHGRGFVVSIGKREPMGLTRTMLLDLSDWLLAAGERANELLAPKLLKGQAAQRGGT